jgi:3-carboxy-cis,cis-muconate cycloisomerase
VTDRLAALLDLPIPEAPWHSHRDRLAELGAGFAILAGSCGKVARDLSLMMQIEVGEAAESAAGTNGAAKRDRLSSVAAAAVSAAAAAPNLAASLIAAQAQEHERGLADGLTEWTALPMLALLTSGAVEAVARMAEGLEIDVDRMRSNLDLSRGRIMAEAAVFTLTEKIGRMEAQTVVQELSARAEQEDRPLKELLLQDPRVTAELTNVEVEKMLIPLTYQGSAQFFLDRLMVAAQGRSARRTDFRPEARPAAAPPTPPPQTTAAAVSPPQTIVAGPTTAPDAPAPQPPAANVQPGSQPARLPPAPTIDPPETGASAEPELPLGVTAPPVAAEPASADRAEATSSEPNSLADVEPVTLAVAEAAAPAPSAPDPEPANDDAPGAFMDILSRAEAETRALAEARAREAKRDRS